MRWMWMTVLTLSAGAACLPAQAGQSSLMYTPFPKTDTVLEVEVAKLFERPNGFRYAELEITRIYGKPEIQLFEGTDRGVIVVDKKVRKGMKIEADAYDPPSFDDDGNPLVLMFIEGEIDRSSIEVSKRYLYIHPSQYFEVTPRRVKAIKKSR